MAANTGDKEAGAMDVFSEFASMRAELHLFPKDFPAANTYQEFSVDFILRSAGYWGFRVYTQGNQPFTADIVKIFPLALLEDKQLLELYPGSEGAIPAEIQPRRNAHPFTGLLVAGALYDYYRIVDAHHLSGYDMKLKMVPIRKGRSQVYVGFPETAQELFDHNVIYLCGADLTALTLRQKNMLAEYVRRGGGLIVFGGHKALDRAGLKGSLLEEVLPVTGGAGLPPLVALPGGAPLVRGAAHPVTQFADFDSAAGLLLRARPAAPTGGADHHHGRRQARPGGRQVRQGPRRGHRHDLLRRARRVADALLAVALVGPAAPRPGLVGRRSGRAFLMSVSNGHKITPSPRYSGERVGVRGETANRELVSGHGNPRAFSMRMCALAIRPHRAAAPAARR